MNARVPLLLALLATPAAAETQIDGVRLQAAAAAHDFAAVRAMGQGVLPLLARRYEAAGEAERTSIALTFYQLSWVSPDAKRVLLRDVHTQNAALRMQVQWALGRVSADEDVVATLLENMRNDPNPLFRDKSACALAYDQIHLKPGQRFALLEKLVEALDDPKQDVRQIALLALQIHTHQTKGFNPSAAPEARKQQIEAWRTWLAEYRSQL